MTNKYLEKIASLHQGVVGGVEGAAIGALLGSGIGMATAPTGVSKTLRKAHIISNAKLNAAVGGVLGAYRGLTRL